MKLNTFYLGFLLSLVLLNCKSDAPNSNSYIPTGTVSLVINTDLPEYYNLKAKGSYTYQTGGNKGVLLIHDFDDSYVALERTCSIEPDKSCAKIFVDSSSLNLRCGTFNGSKFESCCNSRFMYSGQASQGPAQFPLRTYNVSVNGSILTIRN
jgi:Rieske Fe-S protein